ncbi:leucine carboxyl methyltransferase 1-like isoform X2 [Gigantopelta aegis]|uniref:leucine carboxyl methyltransferase 1-like isoform X2 n=1 Tax=Gigantopelta aegis TaxID=1735272 RepID=UPI001B88AA44|nr:leucine carboxyl methyltransferase 1-like isoform X2 [Gigantopelta aegis]
MKCPVPNAQEAVIATNDDATQCKRFAVEKGYWSDPYVSQMVSSAMQRRAPEINRGYYARVRAIQIMTEQFIKLTKQNCQIVNLGAGFDTMYWRLRDSSLLPRQFVEVDFPTVTSRKCHIIQSRKKLSDNINSKDGNLLVSSSDLHADDYHIIGTDLCKLDNLDLKLKDSKVDRSLPTLFICECVLVYIEPEKCEKLIRWISDNFPTAFFLNYEQVNMGDRFGQIMIENLKVRNCLLLGNSACQSLDTQAQRFLTQGWDGAEATPMTTVYRRLPVAEIEKIEKLEFLDELELLDQLFCHYCLCWAYKDANNIGLSKISLHGTLIE